MRIDSVPPNGGADMGDNAMGESQMTRHRVNSNQSRMTLQEMYRLSDWRRFTAQYLPSGRTAVILGPGPTEDLYVGYWEGDHVIVELPATQLIWTNLTKFVE